MNLTQDFSDPQLKKQIKQILRDDEENELTGSSRNLLDALDQDPEDFLN